MTAARQAALALVLAAGTDAVAAEDLPQSLTEGIHAALDAWSEFATTGDLAVLGSSFVSYGPQWRQFEAESFARQGLPDGEPLRLEILEARMRRLDSTTATVWGRVEASRAGHISEVFGWDFDLVRDNGGWRVWTVVEADEPPSNAQVPARAPSVTATTTTTAPVAEPEIDADRLAAAASGSSSGTRLPVLSAWIVVITVVGVALAGYMAPRIDRRGEG